MTEDDMKLARRAVTGFLRGRKLPLLEEEAMVSDAAHAIWRAASRWDGRGERIPYLLQRARFGIIDGLRERYGRSGSHRYKGVAKQWPLDVVDEARTDTPKADFSPESVLGLKHLVDALATGDVRLRRILAGLVAGESKREIAEELGVTPSRVSQLLRRVRNNYYELVAA